MTLREFVGGPWDGELKMVSRGDLAIHVLMDTLPVGVRALANADPDEIIEARIGLYELCRGRDGPLYFKWTGE